MNTRERKPLQPHVEDTSQADKGTKDWRLLVGTNAVERDVEVRCHFFLQQNQKGVGVAAAHESI